MQEDILSEDQTASIAVHVIWFSVLGGDQRSEIRTELIDDSRVTHYWDDDRDISDFFRDHAEELGLPSGQLWDAYLLFAPGATWEEIPIPLSAWGTPVVNERERLESEVSGLLASVP